MRRRNVAFPFLTIPEELVAASPWRVALDGKDFQDAPRFLRGWDYNSTIRVEREIHLVPGKVFEALRLSHPFLKLVARWGTGEGNKPTFIHPFQDQPIPGIVLNDVQTFSISGSIPARDLAGKLFLEVFIILRVAPLNPETPLAPSDKGDVLWHDAHVISLEGGGNRFPVSSSSLPTHLQGAFWYLDLDPEAIEEPFLSAVRLYLNSDREDFLQRIEQGDPLLEQAMMADVVTQLVTTALNDEARLQDIMEIDDESTLGYQMRRWIIEVFETPEVALNEFRSNPGSFHARINAALRMTEEGK